MQSLPLAFFLLKLPRNTAHRPFSYVLPGHPELDSTHDHGTSRSVPRRRSGREQHGSRSRIRTLGHRDVGGQGKQELSLDSVFLNK